MTLLGWVGAICGGWMVLSVIIMVVAIRRAPLRNDWD